MTEILPRLYLGSYNDAKNAQWLAEKNIKIVINMALELKDMQYPLGITYLKVPIDDHPSVKIEPHLDPVASYIRHCMTDEKHRHSNDGILVHCMMGISRSSSIVIYYIMKYHGLSFDMAYKYTKEKRPQVNPNVGFMSALIAKSYSFLAKN